MVQINQPFCVRYELTVQEGTILSVLNGNQGGTTAQQLAEAIPLLHNKKHAINKKLDSLKEKGIVSFMKYTDKEVFNTLKKGN